MTMDIGKELEKAYKDGYEQGKKDAVRHGKWYTAEKYNGYLYWNCDQCHKHFTSQKSNYCPNCGAKMIDGMDGD